MAPLHQANTYRDEDHDPEIRRRQTRIGLGLFAVYALFYTAFIAINTFRPNWMDWTPIAGLNFAVLSGMGLIVLAVLLAILYGVLCRSPRGKS